MGEFWRGGSGGVSGKEPGGFAQGEGAIVRFNFGERYGVKPVARRPADPAAAGLRLGGRRTAVAAPRFAIPLASAMPPPLRLCAWQPRPLRSLRRNPASPARAAAEKISKRAASPC